MTGPIPGETQYPIGEVAVIEQQILLSHNTKAVCTKCGREDAPVLYLKRSHGKYAALCRDIDGSGCWPQSSRNLCRYVDHNQVQCVQLAEFLIAYGHDLTVQTEACQDHVGATVAMIQSSQYGVFPLED